MSDPLYDLLASKFSAELTQNLSSHPSPLPVATQYLVRLATLPLSSLSTTEPLSLAQSSHSNLLALQALSSRSHKSVITSSDNLSTLSKSLPILTSLSEESQDAIPKLDKEAISFSETYSKTNSENAVLDRRKKAMLLAQNVDRLSNILELPSLLSMAITASSNKATTAGANYSTALDLFTHIKRLHVLYPELAVIRSVLSEAEDTMKEMTTNLITGLRGQHVRLAAAIRTIGWLRRVSPEPSSSIVSQFTSEKPATASTLADGEGFFGALFLTARLANLLTMLEALSPLRDLADQESLRLLAMKTSDSSRQISSKSPHGATIQGQQAERYLKRFIEIFREQSFATVSMYRNIFPSEPSATAIQPPLLPIPSPLATFPLHTSSLLLETLRQYLPNVTDPSARESLLTQVLYAAASLGRLGADFGMMIALLEDSHEQSDDDGGGVETAFTNMADAAATADGPESKRERIPEWARVMKKHRIQAGRLESLAATPSPRDMR